MRRGLTADTGFSSRATKLEVGLELRVTVGPAGPQDVHVDRVAFERAPRREQAIADACRVMFAEQDARTHRDGPRGR